MSTTKSTWSYFAGSVIFAIIALMGVFIWGYESVGVTAALSFMVSAAVLAVLETSVSLDNAVVNATVLKHMSPFGRKVFLTVGIFFAVFVVRMVLPIFIVQLTGDVSFMEALRIPFDDPKRYTEIMHHAHPIIMGFGGGFLMMVVIEFFVDGEKEEHWIPAIEPLLAKIGSIANIQAFVATIVIAVVAYFVEPTLRLTFIGAAFSGYAVYMLVHMFKEIVGGTDLTAAVAKSWVVGFVYLEVLDASFSLDGVVAAFAITSNFILIAVGLGIGAMFVRSMTIYLVDKGVMDQFKYLEHSAFWAIVTLVGIMFASVLHIELGEVTTGLISLLIIIAGIVTSKLVKDEVEEAEEAIEKTEESAA
jgi:hypothetical protein